MPRSYIAGVGEEVRHPDRAEGRGGLDGLGRAGRQYRHSGTWRQYRRIRRNSGSRRTGWHGGARWQRIVVRWRVEPDMEDATTERPSDAGWDRTMSESAGTGATAGTHLRRRAAHGDRRQRAALAAGRPGAHDPGAPQTTGGDITTMTGAGYGAGAGASSGGSLGAVSGPDAQTDRAGGSGRAGTSDAAPPTEDRSREGRP